MHAEDLTFQIVLPSGGEERATEFDHKLLERQRCDRIPVGVKPLFNSVVLEGEHNPPDLLIFWDVLVLEMTLASFLERVGDFWSDVACGQDRRFVLRFQIGDNSGAFRSRSHCSGKTGRYRWGRIGVGRRRNFADRDDACMRVVFRGYGRGVCDQLKRS